jgi:hypothetical protein
MLGSADVVILQKVAPKATRIELNDVASTALAVTSGRADAMVTAVFGALVAKNRNPDLGDFVLPMPTVYLPSYVGLRREDNNTLQKFLQAWAEWNNLLGYTEARIKKYLESAGATNIPDNVRFRVRGGPMQRSAVSSCAEGHAICIITGIWRWCSPIRTAGGTASASRSSIRSRRSRAAS